MQALRVGAAKSRAYLCRKGLLLRPTELQTHHSVNQLMSSVQSNHIAADQATHTGALRSLQDGVPEFSYIGLFSLLSYNARHRL